MTPEIDTAVQALLRTRGGRTVAAGTVVTTGTWVGILDAVAGDLVRAEFPGIGSASVRL